MSQAGCSTLQRTQRTRFQLAVILAKKAMIDPEQNRYFKTLASKGSAWNNALAFFLKKIKLDQHGCDPGGVSSDQPQQPV